MKDGMKVMNLWGHKKGVVREKEGFGACYFS